MAEPCWADVLAIYAYTRFLDATGIWLPELAPFVVGSPLRIFVAYQPSISGIPSFINTMSGSLAGLFGLAPALMRSWVQ